MNLWTTSPVVAEANYTLANVLEACEKMRRIAEERKREPVRYFDGTLDDFKRACEANGIEMVGGVFPTIGGLAVVEDNGRVLIGDKDKIRRLLNPPIRLDPPVGTLFNC